MDLWLRLRAFVLARTPVQLTGALAAPVVLSLVVWWLVRSPAVPIEDSLPLATSPAAAVVVPEPAVTTPTALVVQVAGAVVGPGVYRLPPGSRAIDLVTAAGGPTAEADLDAVALAAPLVDGQRLVVPRHGEVVPAADLGLGPASGGPSSPPGPVDLNRATAEELDTLPGVGPATAQAIVEHREREGPFLAVDELLDVRGIGPAKLDGLRSQVTV